MGRSGGAPSSGQKQLRLRWCEEESENENGEPAEKKLEIERVPRSALAPYPFLLTHQI
jgi:hypothetical protein